MSGTMLGEFELSVLLALMRCEADGYGMRVRQEIARRTGREVSIGAVYATLQRLEQQRLVRSEVTAPRPMQGGRRRRVYQLTVAGREQVQQAIWMILRLAEGLDVGLVG